MVTLTVVPPALASLELNPTNVTGGGSSTGTITLTGPASRAGVVIALKSGNPAVAGIPASVTRSEEHTSELQSRLHLVCRLLLEKKKSHRRAARARTPPT